MRACPRLFPGMLNQTGRLVSWLVAGVSAMILPTTAAGQAAHKWDYADKPIVVTSGTDKQPAWWRNSIADGYPIDLTQPLIRTYWRQDPPTPETPQELVFDYPEPVAVTRFVHYYSRTPQPNALRDVRIFTRDDDSTWTLLQELKDIAVDGAQILGIDQPRESKHYRFLFDRVIDNAAIRILEIETWSGTTVGNVTTDESIAGEPYMLKVHYSRATEQEASALRVRFTEGDKLLVPVTPLQRGTGAGEMAFPLTTELYGKVPVFVELLDSNGTVVDSIRRVLTITSKFVFEGVSPDGGVIAKAGDPIAVSGTLRNAGKTAASKVRVTWQGEKIDLGDLAPGESKPFELNAKAPRGGFESGVLRAESAKDVTEIRRPVIVPVATSFSAQTQSGALTGEIDGTSITLTLPVAGANPLTAHLYGALADKQPLQWSITDTATATLTAPVTAGILQLTLQPAQGPTNDPAFKAEVIANDPHPLTSPRIDLDLKLAVENTSVMFRPQIDWYTIEHGANYPELAYAMNSATRMLTTQTPEATLSIVPDTDHLSWGFTPQNEMLMRLPMFVDPQPVLPPETWMPVNQSPLEFSFTLMPRKGDWWEAYRHVAMDYFKFEQPRQWAMPVTQMQMHNVRYIMSYPVWSEKWHNVRSFPYMDFFYNFYGTTYTVPALYSWWLATDDPTARDKAKMVVDWMLKTQEKEGPLAGGWFSQYGEGLNDTIVGGDQAGNRWLMPHSTGTSIKTLLWYWEASGRERDDVLAAARKGCDWLLAMQREDGGWPYAFDLEGKPVTELGDAGQIWCSWALLRMAKATGEAKYKDAAMKSLEFFKRTFMDRHRYEGYWEDVSGAAGKVTRSWEGYEPSIAIAVFMEIGDTEAALACGRDAATWTWTRVIDTRTYETCYGQTTEQSLCGPSQAQSPMNALGMTQLYAHTGDPIWNDYAGAIKAINFCADPAQGYGMVATCGWDDPLTGVIGPPFEGTRPFIAPNNAGEGQFGRGVWPEWQSSQFAWLALDWLIREANLRVPEVVKIDPDTLRGEVEGLPGRVKMPEEKCDVMGVAHYDINWAGFRNDEHYVLVVMNHKQATDVLIRPHEAHLDCKTQAPKIMTCEQGGKLREVAVELQGINTKVAIPAGGSAVLIWDRLE